MSSLLLLVVSFVVLASRAEAAPSALAQATAVPSGNYSAEADGSLLRSDVVDLASLGIADLSVATLDVTHSTAVADSTASPRTRGTAENIGSTSLLGQPLGPPLEALLPIVEQTAPPDNADSVTTIEVPADPILTANVARATANARWAGDTACVAASTPLSRATNEVADATVVAPAAGQSLVGLDAAEDGVSLTDATTSLPATGGPNDQRAVVAEVFTQLAGADVLNNLAPGIASLIDIGVVQAPSIVATATGVPGGASVVVTDPILDVSIGGEPVVRLTAGMGTSEALLPIPNLGQLLQDLNPILAGLQPVVEITVPKSVSVAPDGTSATASTAIAQVRVLAALGTPILTLQIAPITATATAPAGGLFCSQPPPDNPIRVGKSASVPTVLPGGTFSYTITVSNAHPTCTLEGVTVTDVITGPAGSSITSTDPAASSVDGMTATWTLGPLGPGASTQVTVTVKVPTTALVGDSYDDTATATGTCNGLPFETPFTLNDIPSIGQLAPGPVAPVPALPLTGADTTAMALGAGLLATAFLILRRLRTA